MRLLNSLTLRLVEFTTDRLPAYAIFSHTWSHDEVSFDDITNETASSRAGYSKLNFCAQQAVNDGIQYFWIDTCCIDKSNYTELSEAINSQFRWYQEAVVCYVYLEDVRATDEDKIRCAWDIDFRHSRWFTRGWTLQELLAPRRVEFFSSEGALLGNKDELIILIHGITNIPISALKGDAMSEFSVEERMRWTEHRQTRIREDAAYCLLGIFNVFMPIIYGEGSKAFARLQREVGIIHMAEDPLELQQDTAKYNIEDEKIDKPLGRLHYRPLGPSKFRLLTISPASLGEPITADLHDHDLTDPPPYYALSYVWGQEPPIHRTVINGKEHWIRPNLFHALQRVRLRNGHYSIWVDDLCINQNDSSERTTQVRQMAEIYNSASGVVIWLGEEDSTSGSAFDFIQQVSSEGFQWDEQWCQGNGFAAVARLFERAWFRRGWVLQEAVFSKTSNVLCGNRPMYMDFLMNAVKIIRDRLSVISLPSDQMLLNAQDSPAIRFMDIVSSALGGPTQGNVRRCRMSLETLVHRTVYSETTDQRDTIYALLNLANDVASQPRQSKFETITPNYEKPVLDVFADFILHCCERSRRLDIICRPWAPALSASAQPSYKADHINNNLRVYPTWIAPRVKLPFGDPSRRSRNRLHGDPLAARSDRGCYYAHYGMSPQASVGRTEQGYCDGILHTRGLMLGQIIDRSARMADGIISRECIRILRGRPDTQSSMPDEIPGIIWRTLCADRDEQGDRAPYTYHDAMLHLLGVCSGDQNFSEECDLLDTMSSIDPEELLDAGLPDYIEQFLRVTRDIVWNRRTFRMKRSNRTDSTLVGLAPQHAKIGDQVCILYGCSVPVVLRRLPHDIDPPSWSLIGDAYVHGTMDGEMISSSTPKMLRSQEIDFRIV